MRTGDDNVLLRRYGQCCPLDSLYNLSSKVLFLSFITPQQLHLKTLDQILKVIRKPYRLRWSSRLNIGILGLIEYHVAPDIKSKQT